MRADFLRGETDWRIGSGGGSGLAVGCFSERRDDAVRMDLGHIALGATVGDDFVGDFGVDGLGRVAGLGYVRNVVGLGADDESGVGHSAAVSFGLGSASRERRKQFVVETGGAGRWCCGFVLRALDDSKLRCLPQIYSGAVEFAV